MALNSWRKSSETHSYSVMQGPLGICHHIVMAVKRSLMCAMPSSAKGGVSYILRHNEFNEELCDLASKALAPSAGRVELMIHSRRTAEENTAKEPKPPVQRLSRSTGEERGDLLIRGFRARGTDLIVDVRVTDTDAKSYRSRDPHKVLATQEREKKKKYLQSCLEQRKHFTPFVVSTDGFIRREAGELIKDSPCDLPTNGRGCTRLSVVS
jgi:hypothetical protein